VTTAIEKKKDAELTMWQQEVPEEFIRDRELDWEGVDSAFCGNIAAFTMADDTQEKELVGYLAYRHRTRSLFANSYDEREEGEKALCRSRDGEKGEGDPGIACKVCQFREWGEDGTPPACSEGYSLYLVREGHLGPTVVHLPGGHIRKFNGQLNKMFNRGLFYQNSLVKLTRVKDKYTSGREYFQTAIEIVRPLEDREMALLTAMQPSILQLATGSRDVVPF
jgi:hypothetical protein